jgi:hypothetical protein
MNRAVVFALARDARAAGIAYSALSPNEFETGTVVFGGRHAVILGHDRTFSITARNGRGTVVRSGIVLGITCETIVGDAAVVGGTFATGEYFLLEVVDNGLPVGGPAGDQISPFLINTGKPPVICPAPGDLNPAPELDTVDAGDITVHLSS